MYRPPPSVSNYACFTHAKQQSKEPSTAAKAKNQTDQKGTKERKPKTRKRSRRGWVRIRDIKQSQNSQ